MCIENSPSLLCGVDITKYAKGGEYGPNAGLRLCLETKAMFLYACARGYDQDDPAHRQLAIQSCNFDHGDEFLSIISKRLDKTLRHYMKMARTHGLDGDSFNAPADAYQWLVNLKGGIDVEMTDLETVKMNPVLSSNSTISSTPTSTKDLSITPPTWAIGDAWDTLFAHAEREAGSGPDSTFRAILVMEQAINEMKIQVDVMCREMMYKF
ncbi:hypothetical protein CEP52_016848 [Fusarium oligoseptatum]|uniref:Uncharacterized protein n=1 Tax=Fusarium oligoseptatum TaxID=2604345 RepID=A0A428RZ97_9HYPO|nr:hypothetical protein CEP52_016848 [Fusarium oligoseptatum]